MQQTRLIMGMPVSIEITDHYAKSQDIDAVYNYFAYVDNKYSTYKSGSEISRINKGLPKNKWSKEMNKIIKMAEQTKRQTSGYFDIDNNGHLDPSGIVKGWAVNNAAKLLRQAGYKNFYVDAGGDVQLSGWAVGRKPWRVGIRNPFNRIQNIKIIEPGNRGVATSGNYVRGQHIYNPKNRRQLPGDLVSITVIGPNVYEADRFATAAYAMGTAGINFIEKLRDFEAYMVDKRGIATMTSGFDRFVSS